MDRKREEDAKLLEALLSARGKPLSRRDLAGVAHIASEDLEQRLAPYIEAGYPIEFHPSGTVALRDPPDVWCAEEILGRCPASPQTSLPVWDPVLLAETASTNDVAREQARKGVRGGLVVAASRQTKGRGRLGRAWESPPERGLYVSLLLRPDLRTSEAGKLTILSSVAAADAVESISGLRPKIKWPNDLLMEGRKLAGLLIETESAGDQLAFAVIGIGINVRQEAEDFSPDVRAKATSIYLATGRTCRRADLLVALLKAFERRLAAPFSEARKTWTNDTVHIGQRITLTTVHGVQEGLAMGLDESGALLLRSDSGEVETVTAGDMQASDRLAFADRPSP